MRSNNEIITEAFALAQAAGGALLAADYQRLWHEMSDNLLLRPDLLPRHRLDLMTGIGMFAPAEYRTADPPRPYQRKTA